MDIVTLGAALNGSKAYTDQVTQSLMGGVHYRGSVSYYSDLPNDAEEGDSYTVKYAGTSGTIADGTEYTWGYDTDSQDFAWISFSKDTYSKAEIDNKLVGSNIALTGYAKGTTAKQDVSPTDNVNQGLGKIEKRVSDNENNISNIQTTVASYHKAVGTDIYFSETEPTGAITEGSYWISTSATKIKSKNKYNIDNPTMQYEGYINNVGDLVQPSTAGSMCAIIPCVVGNIYTIGVTSRSLRVCFTTGYPTESETTALTPYRQTYKTYANHTHTITAPANAAYMVVNCYLSNIEGTDGKTTAEIFGTLMINDGETAETYTPYWV